MNEAFIKINKIEYPLKFGYGANRILAQKWQLKTLGEIGAAVTKRFNFKKDKEPTFEQWDSIGDLVLSGILYKTPNAKVNRDDIIQALIKNPEQLAQIINLYGESISDMTTPAKGN